MCRRGRYILASDLFLGIFTYVYYAHSLSYGSLSLSCFVTLLTTISSKQKAYLIQTHSHTTSDHKTSIRSSTDRDPKPIPLEFHFDITHHPSTPSSSTPPPKKNSIKNHSARSSTSPQPSHPLHQKKRSNKNVPPNLHILRMLSRPLHLALRHRDLPQPAPERLPPACPRRAPMPLFNHQVRRHRGLAVLGLLWLFGGGAGGIMPGAGGGGREWGARSGGGGGGREARSGLLRGKVLS